jgi:hypothetical protein
LRPVDIQMGDLDAAAGVLPTDFFSAVIRSTTLPPAVAPGRSTSSGITFPLFDLAFLLINLR